MLEDQITFKAIEEIENKTRGFTEQFLEIHKIVRKNNKLAIARIDRDNKDIAIVYFPVVDEKFHFVLGVQTTPEISVVWVNTEPYSSVYFRASSENLTFNELSQLTILMSTGGRKKGDTKRLNGDPTIIWKESTIFFEPNQEPDEFEGKLKKLLDYLEQDKDGITQLVEKAEGYIQVAMDFHNGNTMLGGPHLNGDCIKRMAALNLEIDFDLYANGNFYKEEPI